MQQYPYWQKQDPNKPLFPEIEWNKPERRDQAGKLGIIGGNKLGFMATAEAYQVTKDTGAGEVRVLLPDALKKTVPPTMTDVVFGPTNNSGGLADEAEIALSSLGGWADATLFIGDSGKNSQTAILYEKFLEKTEKPAVITRDAVDLLQNSYQTLLDNPNLVFIVSFAQLQRMFRAVYYPKILTFSMQLSLLVETLHKFTITYPVSVVTFHASQLVIAHNGEVISQNWADPMRIWRGHTATRATCYLLWSPNSRLQSLAGSVAK